MIIVASALHIPLGENTVQCVVTSPPYWGLRDYGISGQLGLEPTPEEYTENMVQVFREVWRVLKDDGVLFLNLGDSYAAADGIKIQRSQRDNSGGLVNNRINSRGKQSWTGATAHNGVDFVYGLKPKDLVGIPWRVAFALQADGWYLRSDIVWAKPNPMPESVRDRCTSSHEHIFMLTKSAKYYYDADAIKEPGTYAGPSGPGTATTPHGQGFTRRTPEQEKERQDKQRGHGRRHAGFNDQWDSMSKEEQTNLMRNKRDVWHIATRPYPDAHYAVFPEEIPRTCILASSKVGDTVLDPFGGSGTTGKVAIELGRKAICMDISKEYVYKHMKARMQTTIGML